MPGSDDALLAGLTVLDFTRVLAGPYCTRLLADLGARVIKVERPGEGDDTRRGHVQLEPGRTDQATYFIRVNAGKWSVALDLAHPKAREVVLDLARAADVVVENFLPGVVAKLGCDYATLTAVRPDLVYCSISGFGQTGPLSLQPAFHHIINAMSGIMHLEQQDDPAPRPGYLQAADVLAGTHAFGAILAALAPQLWPRLVAMMDRPELASDPRFATPAARREHWAELHPIICTWLDQFKTVEDAVTTLTAARVPAAVVLSPAEVVAHPHLAERQAFPLIDHPARGAVRITAVPFHVDHRPVAPRGAAPYRVGEHTRAVLAEVLGLDTAAIDALVEEGAAKSVTGA